MSIKFQDQDFKSATLCAHCATCVTVAHKDGVIAIRDSKDASKSTLNFNHDEWQAFVAGVKNGEFDF
jgi:hypothetical protein